MYILFNTLIANIFGDSMEKKNEVVCYKSKSAD